MESKKLGKRSATASASDVSVVAEKKVKESPPAVEIIVESLPKTPTGLHQIVKKWFLEDAISVTFTYDQDKALAIIGNVKLNYLLASRPSPLMTLEGSHFSAILNKWDEIKQVYEKKGAIKCSIPITG